MADSIISLTPSQATGGLNLNLNPRNLKPGQLTYALNAVMEGQDGQGFSYQSEPANSFVTTPKSGFTVVGKKVILERDIILFWLTDQKGQSEIGQVKDGVYTTLVSDPCLGFSIDRPIHKAFYRIVNCGTEVYWTDGGARKYLNLDKLPFRQLPDPNGCGFIQTQEVDCNQMLVQPNFKIPSISLTEVSTEGELKAGTYQFAVQYASKNAEGYTSYYSITNPLPIQDPHKITLEFDYTVNKAIHLQVSGIDTTSLYEYLNIAVIKSVNNISSFELVGTYRIEEKDLRVVYTGQSVAKLTEGDIFEKFPVYTAADDIYAVQDVLGWSGMSEQARISFQKIANQVHVQWQSYQLKADSYADPLAAANYRGYMRDEVQSLALVPLFKNGYQADYFHIPGREAKPGDLLVVSNPDTPAQGDKCDTATGGLPAWKVYNTASFTQNAPGYDATKACYEGPYQYGEMGYWESTETYPCDQEVWGTLAGRPIRHHKTPDCSTSPHYSKGGAFIFPLGLRINVQQVLDLVQNSELPQEIKDNLQGFKIVRGNRAHHKSVIAKGMLTNVLKYSTKDNVIDPESVKNGTTTQETIVQRLISSARSLVQKARIEAISSIIYLPTAANLSAADNHLSKAHDLEPGSDGFNSELDQADVFLKKVSDKLSSAATSGDSGKGTIIYSYVDSALQVTGSIRDSAEAFLQMQGEDLPLSSGDTVLFPNFLFNDVTGKDPFLENTYVDDTSKERYCFHSPDTSFFQPNLGTQLKLEQAIFGLASLHTVEVRGHARYQFVNSLAYITSLAVGVAVGFASGEYGLSTKPFDGTAAFTTYQTLLDIIRKVTPRKNPCYQVNAVGNYFDYKAVPENGTKQRNLELAQYLSPGMQSVGDTFKVNNYQRESSVYLKTQGMLPFPHEYPGVYTDTSKLIMGDNQVIDLPISAYYGAVKNNNPSQWGAIHSHEMVDTGFQWIGDLTKPLPSPYYTIFGGDTFINRFAYKSKMPFFLDHRVGVPDESDVFYNELSNVGRARYWFSTDANSGKGAFGAIFGVRPTKFSQPKMHAFYSEGKIYLFAYAIPNFFCESTVNVDMRQAFNGLEGDFYPHVGSGIPDDWLQEQNVSIKQDNTYHYNKTYSKQSKENHFTYLPQDYNQACETYNPFLTVYSDPNKWLTYRPVSRYELPQNLGRLISMDSLENKAVLARFENKSILYNTMLTLNTSSPQAAYLGNDTLFKSAPPIELSETDGGYVGSQHKLFLKTPFGNVFTDAKRGCVFLLSGQQPRSISTPEVENFFQNHLSVDGDNHFAGKGLTGVYDPRHKRILLTKLDGKESFTISYNFLTQSWISLHSYLPNYYVEHANYFYAGNSTGLWIHGTDPTRLHQFFGEDHDYIIEYPINYNFQDEILQSVKDYSQVLRHSADGSFVYTDDWFTSAILFNDQQCSGVLKLMPRPRHSLKERMAYPKYYADHKEILYTKSNSEYNFNTVWNVLKTGQPIWKPSQTNLSQYKDLNQAAMSYSKQSHNKAPLMAKNLRIRLINSDTSYRIISNFLTSESQKSFK